MTIEEQIEESRRKLEEGPPDTREQERQRRRQLTTDAVARIDDSLPEALREFVHYGGQDREDAAPDRWAPRFFKIHAPRLAEMAFTVVEVGTSLRVKSIRVGNAKFTSWDAAIVAAADAARQSGGKK
jgi:hypothetical protein